MPANPLEGLKALGDQLRAQIGEELDLDMLRRQEPARPLEELLAELDALPGLESVKEQVRALVAFLRVQARRKEAGLPEVATTQHLVFLGNPGTGKTTVARLLAQMYRSMGLLKRGQLVEVDRAGLVGQYVGLTAIKTERVVRARARRCPLRRRGVRARARRERLDFGDEAIETLLKRMEDHRHRLVVIVAGYPRLMRRFLESNPGPALALLARDRLPRLLDRRARRDLRSLRRRAFVHARRGRRGGAARRSSRTPSASESFGNARFARTLFEQALNAQSLRLAAGDVESARSRRAAAADAGRSRRGRARARRGARATAARRVVQSSPVSEPLNVWDYEALAAERLEAGAHGYYAGGAGDELTLRGNVEAFTRWQLRPRVLVDVAACIDGDDGARARAVDAADRRAGRVPAGRAPGRRGRDGARGAAAGTVDVPLDDGDLVARRRGGDRRDAVVSAVRVQRRGLTRELVRRRWTRASRALVLTVDTPVLGRRERDFRTGFTIPPELEVASLGRGGVTPLEAFS